MLVCAVPVVLKPVGPGGPSGEAAEAMRVLVAAEVERTATRSAAKTTTCERAGTRRSRVREEPNRMSDPVVSERGHAHGAAGHTGTSLGDVVKESAASATPGIRPSNEKAS